MAKLLTRKRAKERERQRNEEINSLGLHWPSSPISPRPNPPNDLLFKDEMKMHGDMNETMHKWVSGQIKCLDESSAIHHLLLNPETPLAAAT